jgi:hypothetical protein
MIVDLAEMIAGEAEIEEDNSLTHPLRGGKGRRGGRAEEGREH